MRDLVEIWADTPALEQKVDNCKGDYYIYVRIVAVQPGIRFIGCCPTIST